MTMVSRQRQNTAHATPASLVEVEALVVTMSFVVSACAMNKRSITPINAATQPNANTDTLAIDG